MRGTSPASTRSTRCVEASDEAPFAASPTTRYPPPHEPPAAHPVHPVLGRLRPCRQRQRRVPPAAPRRRGLVDQHRAVLQPHRLWPLDRAGLHRSAGARPDRRHRRARRAAPLRRGAVRLHGRRLDRRGDPARCLPRPFGKPRRGLLLRPGDRRRGGRRLRARRHRGVPARSRPAASRHRHAQSFRTRTPDRAYPAPRWRTPKPR